MKIGKKFFFEKNIFVKPNCSLRVAISESWCHLTSGKGFKDWQAC